MFHMKQLEPTMLLFIAAHEFQIIGLIFMLILGPAVGNYACSVVYRLPLGKTPFERHPYCGHCNADLQPKDLFPILSWLSTRGRCRYCRGPIPGIYTLIEIACLILFTANFLHFGISENFLLYTAMEVFVVILAAIQWQQGWLSSSIYGYALTCAALARTLQEVTIYGWLKSFFLMLVIANIAARLIAAIRKQPCEPFSTPWIWWSALLAAAVPFHVTAMPLLLLPAIAGNRRSAALYAALAIALPLLTR